MVTSPVARRSLLRRLDDRAVPRLQRGARAILRAIGLPLRATAWAEDRFVGGRPVRALHRWRRPLLFAMVGLAFAGSAIHFQRYPELQQGAETRGAGQAQDVPQPGGPSGNDLPGAATAAVGPRVGADVEAYTSQRLAALDAAPAEDVRIAVVSFHRYLGATEAVADLPAGAVVRFAQLRLPVKEEPPLAVAIIDGDVAGSVERALSDVRDELVEEEAEVRRLLDSGTVAEDDPFLEDYQRRLDELVAVRNLLDSGTGVVFALVVEASVEQLRALLDRASVRLVDLAPPGVDPAASRFHGLVPEDREHVAFGLLG